MAERGKRNGSLASGRRQTISSWPSETIAPPELPLILKDEDLRVACSGRIWFLGGHGQDPKRPDPGRELAELAGDVVAEKIHAWGHSQLAVRSNAEKQTKRQDSGAQRAKAKNEKAVRIQGEAGVLAGQGSYGPE